MSRAGDAIIIVSAGIGIFTALGIMGMLWELGYNDRKDVPGLLVFSLLPAAFIAVLVWALMNVGRS